MIDIVLCAYTKIILHNPYNNFIVLHIRKIRLIYLSLIRLMKKNKVILRFFSKMISLKMVKLRF